MRMPFIKICGIQSTVEAALCIDAGASAIGCLVGITHKAEDKVDAPRAKAIFEFAGGRVDRVMVTHYVQPFRMIELCDQLHPDVVQIHGEAPLKAVAVLRDRLPAHIALVKAIHVTGEAAIDDMRAWIATGVDALLLDSRTPDRLGGTGLTHDWLVSARIVRESRIPVILAGGLGPHNVADAIRTVAPAGVDVNSGVEIPDGSKDPEKVRAFIATARTLLGADAATVS